MRYSYNFLFNSDSGTHTNTLISNGVLKATSATANWVSPVLSTSSTITQAYLIVIGNGLSTVSYQISANDGVNYETITNKNKIIFANQGTSLKIKVVFTDTTAEIDSLSILYKY